jgi:hypothetical protein
MVFKSNIKIIFLTTFSLFALRQVEECERLEKAALHRRNDDFVAGLANLTGKPRFPPAG